MEKDFISILNQNAPILYKVCNLYCEIPEDRADLFQEIVLQLWKAFPNFRKEAKVSTWMYRIALNTAISNFRKKPKGVFKVSLSDAGFEIPDPVKHFSENDNITVLYKAIAQLNALEKAMIMLFLEEKSYQEIAEITGLSKTNVGVKLNRIKNKLEVIIKPISHELR